MQVDISTNERIYGNEPFVVGLRMAIDKMQSFDIPTSVIKRYRRDLRDHRRLEGLRKNIYAYLRTNDDYIPMDENEWYEAIMNYNLQRPNGEMTYQIRFYKYGDIIAYKCGQEDEIEYGMYIGSSSNTIADFTVSNKVILPLKRDISLPPYHQFNFIQPCVLTGLCLNMMSRYTTIGGIQIFKKIGSINNTSLRSVKLIFPPSVSNINT